MGDIADMQIEDMMESMREEGYTEEQIRKFLNGEEIEEPREG